MPARTGRLAPSPPSPANAMDVCLQYDHLEYPGVVPRSFIGPIVVSTVSFPVVSLARLSGAAKFASQLLGKVPSVHVCMYEALATPPVCAQCGGHWGCWCVRLWLRSVVLSARPWGRRCPVSWPSSLPVSFTSCSTPPGHSLTPLHLSLVMPTHSMQFSSCKRLPSSSAML